MAQRTEGKGKCNNNIFTTVLHSIFLGLSLVEFSHDDFLSLGSLDLTIISADSFLEILEIEKKG